MAYTVPMPLLDRRPASAPVAFRVALGRVNPGKFPTALDYFEVTPRSCNTDFTYTRDEAIHKALVDMGYGDKPTRIPVRLLTDDPADWLDQNYRINDLHGRPVCVGNGKVAQRTTSEGTKQIPCKYSRYTHTPRVPKDLLAILKDPKSDDPHAPFQCAFAQNRDGAAGMVCKPLTEFLFFLDIPAIGYTKGAIARFHAKAEGTADELPGSIETVRSRTSGILQGLPFDLVVQMRHMQYADPSGKPTKTRKPVVHLAPRLDDRALLAEAAQVASIRAQLRGEIDSNRLLLVAAKSDKDDAAVAREFDAVPVPPTPAG